MASTGGLIFGAINVVGNLGTVFVDQVEQPRLVVVLDCGR